jgi:hypothetical protein
MYFLIVLALLSTFIYAHLMFTDTINARVDPYSAGKEKEQALLISKIKYALIFIMALSWGAVISL